MLQYILIPIQFLYLLSFCLCVKTNVPAIIVRKFTTNKFRTITTIEQVFYILQTHSIWELNTGCCIIILFTSTDVDAGISLRIITDRTTLALTFVPVSSICKKGESVKEWMLKENLHSTLSTFYSFYYQLCINGEFLYLVEASYCLYWNKLIFIHLWYYKRMVLITTYYL